MRVSTRVEYGMIALTDIAINCEDGSSVSTSDISERQSISQKYLEQILPLLRQAGLVRAQKGIRGGYTLSHPVDEIFLSDILNALDNSILAQMDQEEGEDSSLRPVINDCLWGKINDHLRQFAESTTFGEFISQCRNRTADEWSMYVI